MCFQANVLRLPGRIALAALLAASLTVGTAPPLRAEGRAEPMRVMLTVPKVAGPKVAGPKVAGPKVAAPRVASSRASATRAGGFDWLARRRPAARVELVAAEGRMPRQIGRGSWICSPAGFGQTSRCHAN